LRFSFEKNQTTEIYRLKDWGNTMKAKIESFLKNALILLLGLNSKKKRAVFLLFLIITLILSYTTVYPPGTRASEIQNRLEPRSDQPSGQYLSSVRGDRLNRGKEMHLN
jgi:hypothetical protein